nr:hypothetical protein Iba_chr12bCG8530 [Ipomoea batatas]
MVAEEFYDLRWCSFDLQPATLAMDDIEDVGWLQRRVSRSDSYTLLKLGKKISWCVLAGLFQLVPGGICNGQPNITSDPTAQLGDRMDGQVAVATTEDASDLQMSGSPERIAPTCGGEP